MAPLSPLPHTQRINAETHAKGIPTYLMNLDPAVTKTHYEANIDIRDTVNYKAVMRDYHLGPNGAILTALNLFATNFHQVGRALVPHSFRPHLPPFPRVLAHSCPRTPGTKSLSLTCRP
jgi:hypothetical protein